MRIRKILSLIGCATVAVMVAGSGAQTTPIPSLDLNLGPLTASAQAVNVALALSVEFPTAGAAYRTTAYDHTQTYLGYWDTNACYDYFDILDSSPLTGEYFKRTGAVDSNRYCNTPGVGTGYSGNLLNYAATSSIDLLRYALTGGNRVLDTSSKTVLGRAFLPSNFNGIRNASYFPQKELANALVGKVTPQFKTPGAATNYAGIVYLNSCDDLLYVGNSSSNGSCATPGNANVFAPVIADTSGGFTEHGFIAAPTNSGATLYVLDPDGKKYWARSESGATTTTMPSASDPVAGTMVPEAVGPTTSVTWTLNSGSAGTKNYEGLLSELNSTNWGPTGATGTFNTSGKTSSREDTCTKDGTKYLKINITSNNSCPTGYTSSTVGKNTQLYRLYTATTVITPPPVPTWYEMSLYTVYRVYGTKTAKMKAYVQVCDAGEGPTRQGADGVKLCKRYPNETAATGVYKPIGELQSKAEGVRVSAFGYALENGNGRYGGVLRAPMKFLGNQYRDTSGNLQTNSQAEWDATTGVFTTDPLNAAAGSSSFPTGAPALNTSGVVNYLNKFGSTGTYKSNDPVGELYYEALRYFQGKQPTDAAVSGLTTAMYDNFPIYKTWQDPIQNGCQRRNFILAIGDVNTHYDKQLPGHSSSGVNETSTDPARAAESIPGSAKTLNVLDWTALLAGFETDTSVSYTDDSGRTQNTLGNPNAVTDNSGLSTKATGSSSSAYYWAGAAYWANTQPIRYDSKTIGDATQSLSNVRVKTFTIDVDEGGNGLIDGNTRSIVPRRSSFYLAGKYGWFNDANGDGNPFKTSGGLTNNQEWEDAALPNVPDGYTLASQAQRLVSGIRKFFASASAQGGTVSVSSISSQRFTTSDPNGDLYAPRFDSRDWSGTIIKSSLKLNTTTQTIDALQNVTWDSGMILTTGSALDSATASADPYLKPSERKIFTYRREGGSTSGIEFTEARLPELDAVMRNALNANPVSNATDNLGALRLNYLRGDRSQEGAATNPFRRRSSIMGDIINSGPIYKKEADSNIVDDGGYLSFTKSAASRTAAIYVGANDGMMHAFRASDGKELFAYIPLAVASNLNKLTNPSYYHTSFVDGVPQVGEAKIGTNWRTVLVSGMGGGAQGVFALDVTNPDAFEDGATTSGKVMFEFTDQDDPMMGNVLSQPKLVKLKMPPTTTGGPSSYKWFAAVSSGYNNYVTDGSGRYSTTGDQALFLLSLDKAANSSWVEGSNYFKIVVPASNTSSANGLANPGTVQADDGRTTAMYAGDLQGNLWKFDFSDELSTSNLSKVVKASSLGVKRPLFTATNPSNAAQPITVSPLITTALQRGNMVVFGTGKFMEQNDTVTTGVQSIYGVWDNGGTADADYGLTKAKLQQQTASENSSTVTIAASSFVLGAGSGEKRGWYFNFSNARERIAVEGGQGLTSVTFNSTIPSGDCSGDGNGRSYVLNPLTGSALGDIQAFSSVGLLSRPNYISMELTDTGNYSTRRADGTRKYTVSDAIVSTGTKLTTAGNVGVQTAKPTATQITVGRLSWREIRNFKD